MSQQLTMYFWFLGGFIVAFGCLLFATFFRSSKALRWFCFIGTFCGLVYEGGCFAAASGFGRATGGGGDDGTLSTILVVGIIIAVIWAVVILSLAETDANRGTAKKEKTE
jgi:hypothetical protein